MSGKLKAWRSAIFAVPEVERRQTATEQRTTADALEQIRDQTWGVIR
jgi:hypothetical protein